jgi:hypothetical protein
MIGNKIKVELKGTGNIKMKVRWFDLFLLNVWQKQIKNVMTSNSTVHLYRS